MRYLTILFFLASLFSVSFLFGQDDNSNQDWKALNSYVNKEYSKSISQCRALLTKQSEGIAKNRTKFLLSRGLMELQQYDEAIEILSTTQLDAAFLKSGIPGLIGDCKVEQGKYAEALEFYTKAFRSEFNESTTAYFLFKAFLCARKLNRPLEANQYIQTIIEYFPSYAGENKHMKYLTVDSVLSLELIQSEILQPDSL